jgi:hypothetical protein
MYARRFYARLNPFPFACSKCSLGGEGDEWPESISIHNNRMPTA